MLLTEIVKQRNELETLLSSDFNSKTAVIRKLFTNDHAKHLLKLVNERLIEIRQNNYSMAIR